MQRVRVVAPLTLAPRPHVSLQDRAEKLWPDSAHNQAEWLRAVRVVRGTSGGWLIERRLNRSN